MGSTSDNNRRGSRFDVLLSEEEYKQISSSERSQLSSSFRKLDLGGGGGIEQRSPSLPNRNKYINYHDASASMGRLRNSFVGLMTTSTDTLLDDEEAEEFEDEYSLRLDIEYDNNHHQQQQQQQEQQHNNNDDFRRSSSMLRRNSSILRKTAASKNNSMLLAFIGQIPAVALIAMFHLMIGIPFGVSYFPIGWRADNNYDNNEDNTGADNDNNDDDDLGSFPLPGKEALGIRMFLFATVVGQLVFTFRSGFSNPIGLQMVENVPFCHALAEITIRHVGYGLPALSNLVFMFGLASVFVGGLFLILGKCELGKIIYFFPTHVIVGCIGGIGIFIAKTGIEVTIDTTFVPLENLVDNWNLLSVIVFFETLLRFLEHWVQRKQQQQQNNNNNPLYSLLSPIYFCMITPVFYATLFLLGYPINNAREDGYFFPQLDAGEDGEGEGSSPDAAAAAAAATMTTESWTASPNNNSDNHVFDYWRVVDFSVISWPALWDSIPTLVALTLFSLIHVPINIPAFAISTNTEVDMNNELVAHGYSNIFSGCFGGLQNYMAYTQSVLYHKSGGTGKPSGIVVAIVTTMLFFVGPTIASYIPRCMAGTLLLHVGIDLFLEGVYDSYVKFDKLEYSGIWLIVVVMTVYGMDAAMIAGVISALSTYAVQTITYLNPIRGTMSAVTLRSSHYNRNYKAYTILDNATTGRNRIFVIQLQGHLFFGNMAHLTESMHELFSSSSSAGNDSDPPPLIVIMDCSLVLGIDSSAVQAIMKIKNILCKSYGVNLCVFVTGSSDGFPCAFNLSKELESCCPVISSYNKKNQEFFSAHDNNNNNSTPTKKNTNEETPLLARKANNNNNNNNNNNTIIPPSQIKYKGSHVCDSLDTALIFAENALIALVDPSILDDDMTTNPSLIPQDTNKLTLAQEKELAIQYLANMCPGIDIANGNSNNSNNNNDDEKTKTNKLEMVQEEVEAEQQQQQQQQDQNNDNHTPNTSSSSSSSSSSQIMKEMEILFHLFEREVYKQDDFVWKQGNESDCAKLVIHGDLIACIENEAGTCEKISLGNLIGELGLIMSASAGGGDGDNNTNNAENRGDDNKNSSSGKGGGAGLRRMSSVRCVSEQAILYSINRESYHRLIQTNPKIARYMDLICIKYLSNRVQHVSNRIFETRCLPI